EDHGLERAPLLRRERLEELLHRRVDAAEDRNADQEALDPSDDAAPDDIGRDGADEEDEQYSGEKAQAGDAPAEDVLEAGREEIVDGVPERVQQPRRGDGGNGDEEAGEKPHFQPIAKPRGHNRQMRPHAPNQVKELAGTVALVTGGAVRVGRTIALALAEAGADVAIGYQRSSGEARATVSELSSRGGRAVAIAADIGKPAEARGLIARTVARLGRLDVLVNNAALFTRTPFTTTTPAQFDRIIAVNLRGAFFCAQAAARAMDRRGGRIVNIADVGAVRAW